MRRKLFRISSKLFVELFTGRPHKAYDVVKNSLPADTKIVGVWMDQEVFAAANVIYFLLESESFDVVDLGKPYPYIDPIIRVDN